MLTQAHLRELLHYDPETGIFTWLKSSRKGWTGKPAGHIHEGYVEIKINKINYKAHRLAWLFMNGEFPDFDIDHRDLIRHNNSWNNLRLATKHQNNCNSPIYKNSTSKVKGVYWHKQNQTWIAHIYCHKKQYYLGSFENIDDAAEAVRIKREELHGEFANHG